MESDRFTRFTCDLAKKIDKEEEARASMVEQLFRLQQKALEKKVKEKMRQLSVMETDSQKSPRWIDKRIKKVRMKAEAENAEIERQLAESKALHARRKLRLSQMENNVYSLRSSTLKMKKRSHSADAPGEPHSADDITLKAAGFPAARLVGNDSPLSSGYSTPTSGGSSMKMLPHFTAIMPLQVHRMKGSAVHVPHKLLQHPPSPSSASSPCILSHPSPAVGEAAATTVGSTEKADTHTAEFVLLPPARGSGIAVASDRDCTADRGSVTDRSIATARSNISEHSSTTDAATELVRGFEAVKKSQPLQKPQQLPSPQASATKCPASAVPEIAPATTVSASGSTGPSVSPGGEGSGITGTEHVGLDGECSINSQLQQLQRDMETTRNEIQTARNLEEREVNLRALQQQKEQAKKLYEQKQALVNQRVKLLELEREEREVDELLDRALKLNVDEEAQRKITETSRSAPAQPDAPRAADEAPASETVRSTEPAEWTQRESHLDKLRSDLAEKKRSVVKLHEQRQHERQAREEERQAREERQLLEELRRVEAEAEQLQRPESDVASNSSRGSAEPPSAHSAPGAAPGSGSVSGVGQTKPHLTIAADGVPGVLGPGGTTIPDPISGTDLDSSQAVNVNAGSAHSDINHAGAVAPLAAVSRELFRNGAESDRSSDANAALGCLAPLPRSDTSPHAGSCDVSTNSSDDAYVIEEEVEVSVGGCGFTADEWVTVHGEEQQPSADSGVPSNEVVRELGGVSEAPKGEAAKEREVERDIAGASCNKVAEKTEVAAGADKADDVSEDASSHTASGSETPLRAPTPIAAAAAITHLFIGDDVSSGESDAATAEVAGTTPTTNLSSAEEVSDDASTFGSGRHTSSSSKAALEQFPFSNRVSASRNAGAHRRAPVDKEVSRFTSKEAAPPPRPPSPPPDNLRGNAAASRSSMKRQPPTTKNRQETVEYVVEEVFDMLLEEVWVDLAEQNPSVKPGGSSAEQAHTAQANDNGGSPPPLSHPTFVHDPDCLPAAVDGSPSPVLGRSAANTSGGGTDSTELPAISLFLDAALPRLGAVDENDFVPDSLPSIDSWLPEVADAMRHKWEGAPLSCGTWNDDSVNDASSGGSERIARSWVRLMADTLVETADKRSTTEPKLLGWRRPGFGEPPLSRFNEQRGKKLPVDRLRWREVRERLEQMFRSGHSGSPGSAAGATDNDGGAGSELADGGQQKRFEDFEETIEKLLEEEIEQDEASWLDIGPDVLKLKGQVVQMIFADLIDETVMEIKNIYSGPDAAGNDSSQRP
jgi:hypothetical protein